ncbi:hypothetical protein [Phaeobacter sp. 11ANDIMAR09]|uniref:hypothetical protein n=1 Tax=Phaeobacter sp. 11ANDIMAR09 TaxID=1225647 RepID=UPI0006C87D1B|nr:hypothetical protein AN476_19145 [Phaeobacter sp. 11ANDIMAR09]
MTLVPTHGFRFQGERYDCGSKAGFLQATVSFALSRPELRDDPTQYLNKVTNMDKAAEEAAISAAPDLCWERRQLLCPERRKRHAIITEVRDRNRARLGLFVAPPALSMLDGSPTNTGRMVVFDINKLYCTQLRARADT